MNSDHERMGVARGLKGEKERYCCDEAGCLLWGGLELTEATSRDSSFSIKALRRSGRVCQGFPIPTEHPPAAPPTLNTFRQSRKSSLRRHKPPDSLAMHDQSPAQASKHQQSLALTTWQTCPQASCPRCLWILRSHCVEVNKQCVIRSYYRSDKNVHYSCKSISNNIILCLMEILNYWDN